MSISSGWGSCNLSALADFAIFLRLLMCKVMFWFVDIQDPLFGVSRVGQRVRHQFISSTFLLKWFL